VAALAGERIALAYAFVPHDWYSVMIADCHYVGVYRGIPKHVHTLEAAMQIEEIMSEVLVPRPLLRVVWLPSAEFRAASCCWVTKL
jgi:hypothetical protein